MSYLDDKESLALKAMDDNTILKLVSLFKAVGDETRLKIVRALLVEHELSVGQTATMLNMSDSAVSHQLALLKLKNLVTKRRNGLHSMYKLSDEHVEKVLAIALEHALED